jgi:nicotinate phosphoribosyltransferase
MLDAAGLTGCKIIASNSLDEYLIRDLLLQGAQIDAFAWASGSLPPKASRCFGASTSWPRWRTTRQYHSKIKISENPSKITNPTSKGVPHL